MATSKGQAIVGKMMQQMSGAESQNDMDALGEGAQEMAEAMIMEMPLSALISMAGVPEAYVEEILKALNS